MDGAWRVGEPVKKHYSWQDAKDALGDRDGMVCGGFEKGGRPFYLAVPAEEEVNVESFFFQERYGRPPTEHDEKAAVVADEMGLRDDFRVTKKFGMRVVRAQH